MADTLTNVNQGLINAVTGFNYMQFLGWVVIIILISALAGFGIWWWYSKNQFRKKISVFELINGYYQPVAKDTAKIVKIGRGGFEILYLRKFKTYKIAYGGRIGKETYYFFVGPDGYWYNGILGGHITTDGRIPIVTTSPNMRSNYTALEKQLASLGQEKKSFWDTNKTWMIPLAFILITGVITWLIYRELHGTVGPLTDLAGRMADLVDKVNKLLATSCNPNNANSGIYKVG